MEELIPLTKRNIKPLIGSWFVRVDGTLLTVNITKKEVLGLASETSNLFFKVVQVRKSNRLLYFITVK